MNVIVVKSRLIATVLGLALAYAGSAAAGKILNVVEHPKEGRNEAYLSFHSAATSDVILDSSPDDVSRHNPLTGTYTVRLGDLFPFSNPLTGDGTDENSRDSGICFVTRVAVEPLVPLTRDDDQNPNTAEVSITAENVYDCTWTNHLAGGSIMVSGPFRDFSTTTLAITGGTSKYKNAKGTLAVSLVDIDAAFADFTYNYAFDIN